MVNVYLVAVAAVIPAGFGDISVGGSHYRGAVVVGDINAGMEVAAAPTHTVGGADIAHGGPDAGRYRSHSCHVGVISILLLDCFLYMTESGPTVAEPLLKAGQRAGNIPHRRLHIGAALTVKRGVSRRCGVLQLCAGKLLQLCLNAVYLCHLILQCICFLR